MKRIDGREGGGQLLRLAVALAALEGTPIEIENVRGARQEPGLRAQHVAAVEAVGSLVDADCAGVEVGSERVVFDPGPLTGGEISLDVGTAGSISLLFDAVLPLAMGTDEPVTVHATGGTDVKWSPPIGYHRHVKLPLLEGFGLRAEIEVQRRGFYPRGDGAATLRIRPSAIEPLLLRERGDLESVAVRSIATEDLEDAEVASRQIEGATDSLEGAIDAPVDTSSESVSARSTGTSVLLVASYEHSLAGFDCLGEPGRPAESVGDAAAQAFLSFHAADAAVEEHLADQLLPFLAMRGGAITIPTVTDHVESAAALLSRFGHDVAITNREKYTQVLSGN
ncbi:MAG: RNA 3'-terminal phosphate cyclase [Halodesulfurarchaeum sp.]